MQKVSENKSSLVSLLKENYYTYIKEGKKEALPQMPSKQVSFFIQQAIEKKLRVSVQLNPSLIYKEISEVSGVLCFSPRTNEVILTSKDKKTFRLIKTEDIRYLYIVD